MNEIENKIALISNQVKKFTEDEQKNYCENCLQVKGDFTEYNAYLTDTGTCNGCGKVNDVVNVKIANLILNSDIEIMDYFMGGGKRIFNNN